MKDLISNYMILLENSADSYFYTKLHRLGTDSAFELLLEKGMWKLKAESEETWTSFKSHVECFNYLENADFDIVSIGLDMRDCLLNEAIFLLERMAAIKALAGHSILEEASDKLKKLKIRIENVLSSKKPTLTLIKNEELE